MSRPLNRLRPQLRQSGDEAANQEDDANLTRFQFALLSSALKTSIRRAKPSLCMIVPAAGRVNSGDLAVTFGGWKFGSVSGIKNKVAFRASLFARSGNQIPANQGETECPV
jgi:hypothetical protein